MIYDNIIRFSAYMARLRLDGHSGHADHYEAWIKRVPHRCPCHDCRWFGYALLDPAVDRVASLPDNRGMTMRVTCPRCLGPDIYREWLREGGETDLEFEEQEEDLNREVMKRARSRRRKDESLTPAEVAAATASQRVVLEKFHWRRVVAPKVWEPKDPGAELLGFYGGRTVRNGVHGQYEVALVHVPVRGAYTISGASLIRLLDASQCQVGDPIRIIFNGREQVVGGDYSRKLFDLYMSDGERIPAEDLPQVMQ